MKLKTPIVYFSRSYKEGRSQLRQDILFTVRVVVATRDSIQVTVVSFYNKYRLAWYSLVRTRVIIPPFSAMKACLGHVSIPV